MTRPDVGDDERVDVGKDERVDVGNDERVDEVETTFGMI